MTMQSINPATGESFTVFERWNDDRVGRALQETSEAQARWAIRPLEERCEMLVRLGDLLEDRKTELAAIITREMGKLSREAVGEIEKCAWVCRYYAEHAGVFLADEPIATDAPRSLVTRQPLGVILAVMPWNFPFWQVFRCAVPALSAGNAVLLKHASNVTGCALEIEGLFREAHEPEPVFRTLLIDTDQVGRLIGDDRVAAVSLTGSEAAGRAVASAAGKHLKKAVLELGGSDPFVVLRDADLEQAVEGAVASRFLNCGQSCIAAKRFLVAAECLDEFTERFVAKACALQPGDPADANTGLAPMARADLRDDLDQQVRQTLASGARLLAGGEAVGDRGFFYAPTIVSDVAADSPMGNEEVFGPAAAVMSFDDERSALELANATRLGLAGSVWSADIDRAEHFARDLECGSAFVNSMVKSDPRVPFGGIKDSGYGRELSRLGIEEFTNAKTLWVG